MRAVYLWHRYLGIALCLVFLAWFVSGVVMLYVRMPILFPAERFSLLGEIDPARIALTPVEAMSRAGVNVPPRRVRLIALNERPVFLLLPRGGRWVGIFADNGERLSGVSPEVARAIAHQRAGRGSKPRFVGTVAEIDQWTLTNSLNLHRPLHRLAFDDAPGTEMYVSSVTGEIVMRTTRHERALAWIGPIMHWGAPEVLRTRVPLWRQSMLWISGAGMVLTLTKAFEKNVSGRRMRRESPCTLDAVREITPRSAKTQLNAQAQTIMSAPAASAPVIPPAGL